MKIKSIKRRPEQGTVLFIVAVMSGIIAIVIAATLDLSSNTYKNSHGRVDWNKAYYISENAIVWATQQVLDNPGNFPAGSTNYYSTANATLQNSSLFGNGNTNIDVDFKNAWVSVYQPTNGPANNYIVTASAMVNSKVRTVQATVTAYPASTVFDKEYFINNWGWWWGGTITGNGDQASNWDFDFRGNPVVNGNVYAANQVTSSGVPYVIGQGAPPFASTSLAGENPVEYVHDGSPRVVMPNLLNFSNYIATALANTATNGIWIGSTQVVAGVVNTNGGKTGIYLTGTAQYPITIKGTVVVPGDAIVKGVVTGQGTLYVGGNLYIANNISYANGPSFSPPPETMAPTNRDNWVATNQTKDLVAYAVNGSILGGDVTSSDWITYEYNYSGSGLAHVGDESQLGADGIAGTPDDGIPFYHPPDATHSSGYMSAWYDADGDGKVELNYNYNTDLNMTTARASQIQGYPTSNGTPVAYNQVATSSINTLYGIFYTDHAAAIRMGASNDAIFGSIISRNEQIVFTDVLALDYDSRANSRYHNNPNNIINLGLPYGKKLAVNSMVELTPITTGL